MPESAGEKEPRDTESSRALEAIARALLGLRFGQVTVVVQDGVVIQIERTERTRLRRTTGKR